MPDNFDTQIQCEELIPSHLQEMDKTDIKDILSKINLYKTAYSPFHKQYVAINKVENDGCGNVYIHGRIAFTDKVLFFSIHDLTNYCL